VLVDSKGGSVEWRIVIGTRVGGQVHVGSARRDGRSARGVDVTGVRIRLECVSH
jgi:hypothetical protein